MAAPGPPHGLSWRDATIFGGPYLRLPGWLTAFREITLGRKNSWRRATKFRPQGPTGARCYHPYFLPYSPVSSGNSLRNDGSAGIEELGSMSTQSPQKAPRLMM